MPNEKSEKNITLIGLIIMIVVLSISVVIVTEPFKENITNKIDDQDNNNPVDYDNTTYTNITTEEAYNLSITSNNLTIVDCRGLEGCSTCQFNKGHLPGAEMNLNPKSLFNTTNDILVYSKNGSIGAGFCNDLIGNIKGNIYNLIGGYNAWSEDGYEIETN